MLDVQDGGPSIRDPESGNEQHIPPAAEVDEEWTVSSRWSLYASLIFPFSLEDSISWDVGQDFHDHEIDFFDVLHSLSRQEAVLCAVNDIVGAVGFLECGPLQSPGITSTLSCSDSQHGNLPSSVNFVNTGDDLVRDGIAMPISPQDRPVFFLSPAVDRSLVAGSTTSSTSEIPDSNVQNSEPCEEGHDTACDLRMASLLRRVDVLHGSFVSPANFSVFLPVSESKSRVTDSLTPHPAMGVASIDCDTVQNVSVPVNTRRARPVAIYGPLFPSMITPDAQDTLLSNSGESLDQSALVRRMSPSRHGSRHGSALRPLVLPMRVATHNSSNTGDTSFERTPDMLLQSNRIGIGFPPPFPLPELPLYKSPSTSTSTITASCFPKFEELDAFQKLQSTPTKSLTSPEPLSTYSGPELEESYPDSDGEDSTQTINWGVAF